MLGLHADTCAAERPEAREWRVKLKRQTPTTIALCSFQAQNVFQEHISNV